MPDQAPKHIFISYVREDQEQVDKLCNELENHGVKVWLDRKSIKPGARWKDAIRVAIRKGDFFIACFSNKYASKTKSYMNEELTLAVEELRQYGSGREWFIPVLLSECDVPARSIGAGETLLDINRVPLYEDWNAGIKRILSVIKPIPASIQNLISALRSDDKDVRKKAAEALGKIGPEAEASVPVLVEALKDKDKRVCEQAACALGEIGPKASAAVPALIEALRDEDEYVRRESAVAMTYIEPKAAKAAVPVLIEALKDKDELVRKIAADSLGVIGSEAKPAVPALIEMLKDNDNDSRQVAAVALASISPEEARDGVPALIEALKEDIIYKRRAAANALGRIGPAAEAAVPALIANLKYQSSFDNYHSYWANWNAVPALEKINTHEAQKALEQYRQNLIDELNNPDVKVRQWAANLLGAMGTSVEK